MALSTQLDEEVSSVVDARGGAMSKAADVDLRAKQEACIDRMEQLPVGSAQYWATYLEGFGCRFVLTEVPDRHVPGWARREAQHAVATCARHLKLRLPLHVRWMRRDPVDLAGGRAVQRLLRRMACPANLDGYLWLMDHQYVEVDSPLTGNTVGGGWVRYGDEHDLHIVVPDDPFPDTPLWQVAAHELRHIHQHQHWTLRKQQDTAATENDAYAWMRLAWRRWGSCWDEYGRACRFYRSHREDWDWEPFYGSFFCRRCDPELATMVDENGALAA
jgi:hypothetical protein